MEQDKIVMSSLAGNSMFFMLESSLLLRYNVKRPAGFRREPLQVC